MMADVHPSDSTTATQTTLPADRRIPTSAQEISIHLHPSDQIPTAAQAIPIDEDVLRRAFDKVEDDHKKILEKIHRFPASRTREFCEERGYIAPKVVAIGPYYHGHAKLQEMEEVKKAAAYDFCRVTGQSPEAAYEKVRAVAGDARRCYDSSGLNGVSDAAFASMMFHDACFLLVFMFIFTNSSRQYAPSLLRRMASSSDIIMIDIFLLENQIPWVVFEALEIHKLVDFNLSDFISSMGMRIQLCIDLNVRPLVIGSYRPPHLLGIFHFYLSGCRAIKVEFKEEEEEVQNSVELVIDNDHAEMPRGRIARVKSFFRKRIDYCTPMASRALPLGTGAIELAEIGVELVASKTAELNNIRLTKCPLFPKLFLPPLCLGQTTASWLLNMAAFEVCTDMMHDRKWECNYVINSYLAVIGTLMDREKDVHELRAKHLIIAGLNNQQLLDFFRGRLSASFCFGDSYFTVLESPEEYKRKMRVWIAIHRFVYHNIRTIVTVLSIISVLVAIFKTLLSLKQQYRAG